MLRPDTEMISENERLATRVAQVAVVAPALLVGVILLIIVPWWLAIVVAVAVGALLWWRARSAEVRLLTELAAAPADATRHARLINLADGLSVQAGVRVPALHVGVSSSANALALGRDERASAVIVTTGLLDRLGRVELEGVLAQLLVQLRSADTEVRTSVFAHAAPLASIASGLYGKLVDRVVEPDRRFRNDAAGVSVTRFPPGLVAAYEALDGHTTMAGPVAAAHLWMLAPGENSPSHPATAARIAALREL